MHDAQPTNAHAAAMSQRTRKRPNRISIEEAANGGYVVNHSYDNNGSGESYQPPTTHAFSNHSQLIAHLGKMYGKVHAKGPFTREGQTGSKRAGIKPVATKAQGRAASRKHGRGVD